MHYTPALYPRMPRSTNQISISFSGRWAASQDMIGQLCSFFLNWPITRVLIHSSPSSQNLYLIVTCCLYQLTGRCKETNILLHMEYTQTLLVRIYWTKVWSRNLECVAAIINKSKQKTSYFLPLSKMLKDSLGMHFFKK